MEFTKMEGLGNDYVYINCLKETVEQPSELAKKVSDRHFGIGSDGLILIKPSKIADFTMDMYNADGSQSEMCGNGIRCVGKYVYDFGLTQKTEVAIETLAGIKYLQLTVVDGKVTMVTVDMGEPILEPAKIPVVVEGDCAVKVPITAFDQTYEMTCVSMGNPHAIIFVEDTKNFPLEKVGSVLEVDQAFPNKANIEFIEVLSKSEVNMRVWERGTGETLACGTGACASTVAAILNGLTNRKITLHLLGGDLIVEWNEKDQHVYMTGPATTVFSGTLYL